MTWPNHKHARIPHACRQLFRRMCVCVRVGAGAVRVISIIYGQTMDANHSVSRPDGIRRKSMLTVGQLGAKYSTPICVV